MSNLNNDNTFSFKESEESTGFLLWKVMTVWQKELKNLLESNYEITHSQYVILANIHWLTLHGEEVTQIRLSENSKIEPMNVSKILNSLKMKGFISKTESKSDSRAKWISLTDEGKEITKKAAVTVEQADKTFFSALNQEKIEKFNTSLLSILHDKTI